MMAKRIEGQKLELQTHWSYDGLNIEGVRRRVAYIPSIRFGHFDGSVARSISELVPPLDGYDECQVAIMANLAGGWIRMQFL
jgi:hypothetical protein